MASAEDAAAKQRIISHMNADHQDSVARYLEYYHKLSSSTARTAKLEDVSLSAMRISAAEKSCNVPFDPPLKSFREIRERVVQMDKDALKALGRSDITLREYIPPKGFQKVIFAGCLLGYLTFGYRDQLLPGHPIYELVYRYVPGYASIIYKAAPIAFYLMVAIHIFETAMLHQKKLRKHSVATFSIVWWKWIGSTFVEGFGAFQRINAYVKEKEIEKEKHKH